MPEIQVIFDTVNGIVAVSPESCLIPFDPSEEQTITWVPDSNVKLEIAYVGFDNPVGKGFPLGIPEKAFASQNWQTTDLNDNTSDEPVTFSYHVFAQVGEVVFEVDPEIINEPERPG